MPDISMSLLSLAVALFGLCAAAAVGAPLVSFISEIHGWTSRRVFADKFAQQMSRLAVLTGLITLIVLSVSGYFLLTARTGLSIDALIMEGLPVVLAPALGVLALVLLIAHTTTFRALRRAKALHLIFILLALCVTVLQYLAFAKLNYATTEGGLPQDLAAFLETPLPPMLPPLGAQILLLSPGAAGCLGLLYLLMRRLRDDFGRDYYRWSAPTAAKWAVAFPLNFIILGWIYSLAAHPARAAFTSTNVMVLLGGSILCALGACILWTMVIKNDNPLRLKGRMILAGLLALAAITLNVAAYIGPLSTLLF